MLDKLASTARRTGRIYGKGTILAVPVYWVVITVRSRKDHAENDFGFTALISFIFAPMWPWAICAEYLDWRDRQRRKR